MSDNNDQQAIDWTPVDEALAEGTGSGAKLAVLEAGKILTQALAQANLPGVTPATRLKAAGSVLTNPKDVAELQTVLERLNRGSSPQLNAEQAKRHVQTVRQTMADLSNLEPADRSRVTRLRLLLGAARGQRQLVLQVLGGVVAAFILILFLADTEFGQAIVAGIVGLVHFFFRWLIGLVILLVVLAAAVAATALYLDRRQAEPKIKQDD